MKLKALIGSSSNALNMLHIQLPTIYVCVLLESVYFISMTIEFIYFYCRCDRNFTKIEKRTNKILTDKIACIAHCFSISLVSY